MRIAFVIPSLGAGGAERVASLLANTWTEDGHDVALVTFERPGAEPFFALAAGVSLHALSAASSQGLGAKLSTNLARVTRLRSLLRTLRPDVVVSFMTEANVVAALAASGLQVPVVVSERNQPDRPGLGSAHKLARRLSYPLASAIVVQTDSIAAWAKERFRLPVEIIPNPVRLADAATPRVEDGVQRIVAIGRLAPQKGFDILFRSFAALAGKHPHWRLVIYGEGPDRAELERLRGESSHAGRILLPGLTKDSIRALRGASLFVLPSRFEGYPNALLEALAEGLPVLATACPGGTAEILADGAYGMLVPPGDLQAMTAALDAMLSDPSLRDGYARKARQAVANLDVAVIGKRWLNLFAGLKS